MGIKVWSTRRARRKAAYKRLKELVGWKDAQEVLYLVKWARESMETQTKLLEVTCDHLERGEELWRVRADLVEIKKLCE